jgi:hypothetical protein
METGSAVSRKGGIMRRRFVTVLGMAIAVLICIPALASAAIRIDWIYFDPPGSDTSAKRNQEYVVITNKGNHKQSLANWRLRDRANHVFLFPSGFKLKPGKSVRVHTGHGQDDHNDLYWDSGSYIWNNDGDKATLKSAKGKVKDTCSYGSSASSPVNC